jgi:hypothetical protein
MADNTAPDTDSIGNNWPEESIEIPSNPADDSDAEKFGAAPQMQMLTPIDNRVKVKADPRTLPGSFFFMDVFPSKRADARGQPSALGPFNALAYDPDYTGKETPAQITERYKRAPPYIETLTDTEQSTSTMADIRGTRGTIGQLHHLSDSSLTMNFENCITDRYM